MDGVIVLWSSTKLCTVSLKPVFVILKIQNLIIVCTVI